MEFDSKELKVLKNAFNASDIDGDGVLSKNDIQQSSGLQSAEEVDGLFRALKGEAWDGEGAEMVTFEEFILSFLDFPFLFERFADEYEDLVEDEN